MNDDEAKLVAFLVLGCILGALLVLGYHAVRRFLL